LSRYEFCLVALSVLLEEVGKEKHFQYSENDEKLDEDNSPQRASQLHVAEPVVVELEDTV
jgi:hypothetical protein